MERQLLIAIHISANLIWVGAALATALLLAKGPGDAKARGAAGLQVFRTLARPAFILTFIVGLVQLGLDPTYYFKATHFMHAKLPLALGAIGLSEVIGARARRMAEGQVTDAGPVALLGGVFAFLAVLVTFIVVLKPF